MRILHCKKKRQTNFYWLTSKIAAFDYEIIAKADCPKCKNRIMEYYGLSLIDGLKFMGPVRHRDCESWELRFKSDLVQIITAEMMESRNMKAKTFVGEYTQKASQDPADARHYILKLLKKVS